MEITEDKKNNIEIAEFIKQTKNLDWSNQIDSLNTLHDETIRLIMYQIAYYDGIRQKHKKLSKWLRIGMLIFGACGMISPLAEGTQLNFLSPYGYILLVISGVFLTADKLFGGTSGHIRYSMVWLKLEKLVASRSLKWNELIKNHQNSAEKNQTENKMFQFIVKTIEELYALILNETSEWDHALTSAIEHVGKQIGSKQKEI